MLDLFRKIRLSKRRYIEKKDDYDIALELGLCPDCMDPNGQFYHGPGAPGAQNLCCANPQCYSHWNQTPFGMDRIRHIGYSKPDYPNYHCHSPKIINNWTRIGFSKQPSLDGPVEIDASPIFEWCGSNLLHGWSVKDDAFYFEDPEDAMLFKLTWIGNQSA